MLGGDGTHRGGSAIAKEIERRKLQITVAGIPKTIDNDFQIIDFSFGFNTAVEEAVRAIKSAKVEAQGAPNGIGLVKLMGRQSGFIAVNAALASRDVDYCLIPEVSFNVPVLLAHLKRKLLHKRHAVIVIAEGAGADILESTSEKDKSGNPVLPDVGRWLKTQITDYFSEEKIEVSLKYIDPTYMIRAVPPNASDAIYCGVLGQNSVHASMAGYTCFTTALVNTHYCYIPIDALIESARTVDPAGKWWHRLIDSTGQPDFSSYTNLFTALSDAVQHCKRNPK